MGFTIQPSKADLYKILRAAERFVTNGEIAMRGSTDVYFSRKGDMQPTGTKEAIDLKPVLAASKKALYINAKTVIENGRFIGSIDKAINSGELTDAEIGMLMGDADFGESAVVMNDLDTQKAIRIIANSSWQLSDYMGPGGYQTVNSTASNPSTKQVKVSVKTPFFIERGWNDFSDNQVQTLVDMGYDSIVDVSFTEATIFNPSVMSGPGKPKLTEATNDAPVAQKAPSNSAIAERNSAIAERKPAAAEGNLTAEKAATGTGVERFDGVNVPVVNFLGTINAQGNFDSILGATYNRPIGAATAKENSLFPGNERRISVAMFATTSGPNARPIDLYSVPLDQLIKMVPGMAEQVNALYEKNQPIKAEDLDAQLDEAYTIIESSISDIEDNDAIHFPDNEGIAGVEASRIRDLIEAGPGDVIDGQEGSIDELMAVEWERFLEGQGGRNKEEFIRVLRGLVDEFSDRMGGEKNYTDEAVFEAAREAYQLRQRRGSRKKTSDDNAYLSRRPNIDDLTPEQRAEAARNALTAAENGLAGIPLRSAKVVGDMSIAANFLVHPRQVATLHKTFTPVYSTAVSQFEMRDRIIDTLSADYSPYMQMRKASKEKVNKLLELGRIIGVTYTQSDKLTTDGIIVPYEVDRVIVTEEGEKIIAQEPIQLELSQPGDKIKLTEEEATAYLRMRDMFNAALNMFKSQMLKEFGLGDYAGMENVTAEIMKDIESDPMMPTKKLERLLQIAKTIEEIEQAKRRGYVPLAREGDYVVTVKQKPENMTVTESGDNYVLSGLSKTYNPVLEAVGGTKKDDGTWLMDPKAYREFLNDAERVIYSTKVETGFRDAFSIRKLGRKGGGQEKIPSVKKAIIEINEKWVKGHSDRRIDTFPTNKINPENINLDQMDNLASLAGVDNEQWDIIRDQMANEIKGRSFRRHFFRSDNVPGYSTDFERSISSYISGMGGYLSRRHHIQQWDASIKKIKAPRLHGYANKYREYTNNPTEEFAMLRQTGFLMYIAGNLSTALVNVSQVPVMTMPFLKMISGNAIAGKEVARAYKDALLMFRADRKTGLQIFDVDAAPADIATELKEAWAEGAFVPLETYEVMATARTRGVGQRQLKRKFERSIQAIAYTFTAAERLNRLVTFIAAARIVKSGKYDEKIKRVLGGNHLANATLFSGKGLTAKKFGEFAIDETQFRMGKVNRPHITRGVGSAIMQFKGFMLQSLEAWYRWSTVQGKEGKLAAASSLVMMMALGGLWGFPGGEEIKGLIEALYRKLTKEDKDLETDLRLYIAETSGQQWLAEFVTKGAGYPMGIDLSRIGMGDLLPDDTVSALGIPYDLTIGRATRAFEKASQGQYVMAGAEFLPNFVKNPVQAVTWASQGVRDGAGRRILTPEQVRPNYVLKKSFGFQPSAVTSVRDYEYAQYRAETAIYKKKTRILNSLAKTIVQMEQSQDPDLKLELQSDIEEIFIEIEAHNQKQKSESRIITISDRALDNRIRREMEGVQSTYGRERTGARSEAEQMRRGFGINEILSQEED